MQQGHLYAIPSPLTQLPPTYPQTPNLTPETLPQEYQELVAQFKRHEQQLYQFCEEKVTLAHHAADLIQQHQKELEAVSGGQLPGWQGGVECVVLGGVVGTAQQGCVEKHHPRTPQLL